MSASKKFLYLEFFVFLIISLLTTLEIFNFNLFEKVFLYLQSPSSWLIGFSFGYVFSKVFEDFAIPLLSKLSRKKDSPKNKNDLFIGFLIVIVLIALIVPYLKLFFEMIFNNFFIYFHLIFLQSIILLYLFYKLRNNYEISADYVLINEIIILINLLVVIIFVS